MALFSVLMEFTFHRRVWLSLFGILLGLACVSGVQFLSEPADVTKTYTYGSTVTGDSFLLDCQVDSLESNQKVSWFKNREVISDGYDFRDSVEGRLVNVTNDRYRLNSYGNPLQFTLQVRSVSPSTAEFDSGDYQCAVTLLRNDIAVPGGRSKTATVNIYVIPSSNYPVCKVSNPNGQDVITAERTTAITTIALPSVTHTLTCLSSQSTPVVGSFWSRNDRSGSLPRKTTGDDNGLLYVTYDWIPSRNDGSTLTFTCTLQHPGLLTDRTCSITFNIHYAPIVTIDPTDVMVTEKNDEIMLLCNQDANPQDTEPVWLYDDDVVNSGGRFRLEGMSLRILGFSPSENGVHTVTCQLTNAFGTGTASTILTVYLPSPSTIKSLSTRFLSQEFARSPSTASSDIDIVCPQSCQCECEASLNRLQTGKISISLGVGLLFIGILEGVLSTVVICFLLHKYGRTPWRYGNNSNIADSVRSRDGIELKSSDYLGMDKETDEQHYQVIQKTDSTTVNRNDESGVKSTGTAIHANVPSSEDEHYQSLGKQSDSLYERLTRDNKI